MDCKRREAVQDYLDGLLAPREAASMAAHLRECAGCAREAEAHAALDASIRALPRPDPGPAFTAAVMRSVRRAPKHAPAALPWFSLSPCEAAGLALLYGGLALLLVPARSWLAGVAGWQSVMGTLRLWGGDLVAGLARLPGPGEWPWLATVPSALAVAVAAGAVGVLAILYRAPMRAVERSTFRRV